MATYRTIAASEMDANSPVTTQLITALEANPTAIAEGASGAPKIALKSLIGSYSTGHLNFTGLGAWSGVWFSMRVYNANGAATSRNVQFNASDDGGTTWLGAKTMLTLNDGDTAIITGFFDFATGVVHGCYSAGTDMSTFSQTIAGASLAIDAIRFVWTTDLRASVIIHPNGGASAS